MNVPDQQPIDSLKTAAENADAEREALRLVIELARGGDPEAVPTLRAFLRERRGAATMLGGDLAWESRVQLVRCHAGSDLAIREAAHEYIEQLRRELVGSGAIPQGVEHLLIERVIATWLHLYYLENLYAVQESPSNDSDLYYERALSMAQRRYLAVVKLFADQRKQAPLAVQINLAREQVNLAGNVTPLVANGCEKK